MISTPSIQTEDPASFEPDRMTVLSYVVDDTGSSTGGSGGDMDPNVICDVGLCLTNEVAKADCVNDVSTCISVGMRVDECIGVALLENCNVAEQ